MQTPPNYQSNYFTPFGAAGGQAAAFGQQGRAASPFLPGGFPGLTSNNLGQFMQSQGFRQHRGNWIRPIDMGSRQQSSRMTVTPQYAQFMHQQAMGPMSGLGGQAAEAAVSDFNSLSQIIGQQNIQRADYLNQNAAHRAQVEGDRQTAVGGILNQGERSAQAIEQQASGNYDEFKAFRDQQIGAMEDYANQIKTFAQGKIDAYDENALGSISAAAAGIAQSANNQVRQIEAQARAQGLSEDMVSSMSFQARGQAAQQMQSAIAPMIDQKNQFKLQAGMQAADIFSGALANAGQMRSQAMGLTEQALARKASLQQSAEQFRTAARMEAVQANMQFEQVKMMLGEQRANALQNLTQQYPSLYDTVLQAGFGMGMYSGMPSMNFGSA